MKVFFAWTKSFKARDRSCIKFLRTVKRLSFYQSAFYSTVVMLVGYSPRRTNNNKKFKRFTFKNTYRHRSSVHEEHSIPRRNYTCTIHECCDTFRSCTHFRSLHTRQCLRRIWSIRSQVNNTVEIHQQLEFFVHVFYLELCKSVLTHFYIISCLNS